MEEAGKKGLRGVNLQCKLTASFRGTACLKEIFPSPKFPELCKTDNKG